MMSDIRGLVLYIMTKKGFVALEHLVLQCSTRPEYVVVGKDKNLESDYAQNIEDFCEYHGIQFFSKAKAPVLKSCYYVFAVSWRWMINHPVQRLVIFHDSLLPRYRGFAPLVNMLINGEREIGFSAILGAAEYDLGDILAQSETTIDYPLKVSEAIEINNENLTKVINLVLPMLRFGQDLAGERQIERCASYSLWRDSDDYFIDWHRNANEIVRFIDAVGWPYKGAQTRLSDNKVLFIEEAETVEDVVFENRDVGKVAFVRDGFPIVVCGQGLLKLTKAKLFKGDKLNCFLPVQNFRYRFF